MLGHVSSDEGIVVDEKKVEISRKLQPPINLKQLSIFLGKIQWHAQFLHHLANLAHPLYKLMKKGAKYYWTKSEEKIFDGLKRMLLKAPILRRPD